MFREERDAYLLGMLRVALACLLFLNSARLALEFSRGGYFGEFFHLPVVPEAWVPSRAGYQAILGIQLISAVSAAIGLWPRATLGLASSLGLYVLTLDRLQYHNNRYALLLLGFVLAVCPCDRAWLLVRRPHTLPLPERIAPTFARRLFQAQVSIIYLGSVTGKLLDPDWRGGQVLLMRFVKTVEFATNRDIALPHWCASLLASEWFASAAAKGAISTELFIALGLWFKKTRPWALWVGLGFHFWIEVSARVELFSYVMGAAYLAFVVPELGERRFEFQAEHAGAARLARVLRWLDWFKRFEIAPVTCEGAPFRVVDRDGRAFTGLRGIAGLARGTPLLFPFWPILRLISAPRRQTPAVDAPLSRA